MSIRILIADDHRIMRAGLKSLLQADSGLEVIGEATTSNEAMILAMELFPDVILLDIGMPGNENLDALKDLVKISSDIKILILTMHEDTELLQECLRNGASGYIIKRAAESELVDAIYAVQRGIIYVHPDMIQSLVSNNKKNIVQKEEKDPLTNREIEVLVLIAKGNTNRQISEQLNISTRTVETHRSNIMDKLNLHSRVELVRYASENKLI
jgi:two-component system response regulator NreC